MIMNHFNLRSQIVIYILNFNYLFQNKSKNIKNLSNDEAEMAEEAEKADKVINDNETEAEGPVEDNNGNAAEGPEEDDNGNAAEGPVEDQNVNGVEIAISNFENELDKPDEVANDHENEDIVIESNSTNIEQSATNDVKKKPKLSDFDRYLKRKVYLNDSKC